MRNKFVNLIAKDLVLDLKIALIAVLVAFLFSMYQGLDQQRAMIVEVLKEQRLRLMKDLAIQTQMLEAKSEKFRSIKASLKGIVFQNGLPSVLVGNDVYQTSDNINGFTILRISFNSVLFRDDSTGQRAELYLHYT